MEVDKKKVIFSLIYKFIERLAVKSAGLVIGIILARLLVPEEFGQVAIITVFINLANTIIQNGFNSALVQKKEVDERDYSTVFYITGALSLGIIGIMYVSAPLIAAYYDLPLLVWPIRVYSFSLLFGAFNSIQVAKIQREMRFKSMMYASLLATLFSGALGVAMAYKGYGIWALVFYGCSNIVFSCITMLPAAKWFPHLTFSFDRAKQLFSFGWKMLISGILCSLYNDIRSLIIGKRYSVDELGYYNRGQQYPDVIFHTCDGVIQSVMFPTMSRNQSDTQQMRSMFKRSISFGTFIMMPILIGLMAVAKPFILLLLTEKWLPCVIYMQIICLASCALPFTSSSLIAIKSLGRSDIYMKLEIVRRIIMLAILLTAVFVFDSVMAIAISYAISSWIDAFVAAIPLKKLLDYDFRKQVKDNWKTILASFIMGVIVYFVGLLPINLIALLCVQILCGGIIYILLCIVMRIESFYYLISMIKGLVKKH
ncbi:MAG: lipopolysaccharide biosynthesis protein [Ruminococcaceae bacterium]|nr:lipopolysaccharide biosynthesis protein [Oscillospiraceae bacterium]